MENGLYDRAAADAIVNSISETIGGVDHVAGVAQLGAGRLALVLSVPDLVQRLGDDGG